MRDGVLCELAYGEEGKCMLHCHVMQHVQQLEKMWLAELTEDECVREELVGV